MIDKKPALPIPITDVQPRNAGTSWITGVTARVQRERPGGGWVSKAPVEVDERFDAAVVSCGFETERIAGELDQTVIFLIEHAVDEFSKLVLRGDVVLAEICPEVCAALRLVISIVFPSPFPASEWVVCGAMAYGTLSSPTIKSSSIFM